MDVDHLAAAANPQHRQIAARGMGENPQLQPVALFVDAHRRRDFTAIQSRVDIVAAADHQPVKLVDRKFMVCIDADRTRARAPQREFVGTPHPATRLGPRR